MSRYFEMPAEPIVMLGQDASEPAETPLLLRDVFAVMFKDSGFLQHLDLFEVYDLRKKLTEGKPRTVVELREAEHEALKARLRKPVPGLFNPALTYSPDFLALVTAILNAPSKRPERADAPAP